ncbi:MAG: CCA tRNA nucleotidyltransferase [Candidatus Pacebacteria bacterium]|nr:CCA tRNA nucleotidyltransferase [Candidatus Paceibacterota bacterium]
MNTLNKPSYIDIRKINSDALSVVKRIQEAGYEAYLVGGCVRDLIMNREPKDWDVTTNAKPEQIIAIFEKTFYENTFGTVGVVILKPTDAKEEVGDKEVQKPKEVLMIKNEVIEVTPYRVESEYKDGRRPESVTFSDHIEDDLKRRDFTINALAFDPIKDILIDLFDGIKDIKDKTIRAVGNPLERFQEDGLRVLRAVRFSAELGFTINKDTQTALYDSREMLEKIAKERIRDEFSKIIMSDYPMVSLFMCQKLEILKYIVPELEEGVNTEQNQAHSYTVFEHLLRSLQCAADKKYPFEVRLSALLHDIGKPESRRFSKEKKDYTFYGHEVIGANMAKKILERLNFPRKTIDLVYKFVRWHMFFSDTEQISLSAVRRMIANVSREHIWDLMNLRICDRVGTGRPKENPYRLRKYTAMIDQVLMDPVSVSMLKIDGKELMEVLHVEPGPKIGLILNALLEEVIEDPTKNDPAKLSAIAERLNNLDIKELIEKADNGKKLREDKEKEALDSILKKHHVS